MFNEFQGNEQSKIFNNEDFGYYKVTVCRPLRQKVIINLETIKQTLSMLKSFGFNLKDDNIPEVTPSELLEYSKNNPETRKIKMPKSLGQLQAENALHFFMLAIIDLIKNEPYMDINKFEKIFNSNKHAKSAGIKFSQFTDFMIYFISKDPNAEIVYKSGKPVVDTELTETEQIPLNYDGGIDVFMEKEVLPFAPDAWVDEKQTKIGYEISFTKHFYKPVQLRPLSEIIADIRALEAETDGLLEEVLG